MKGYTQLTIEEREELYRLLKDGITRVEIAEELGRDRSTIYRELRRNRNEFGYLPDKAQTLSKERCWKGSILQRNPDIRNEIAAYLQEELAPGVIAGIWKNRGRVDRVCSNTIYSYAYSKEGIKSGFYKLLNRSHKRRGQWFGKNKRESRIPDRVSIHDRHGNINNRRWFGHWETDLMIFSNHQTTNLVTLIERKSRLILFTKNYNRRTSTTMQAIQRILKHVPEQAIKSMTFDNGNEFTQHTKLGIDTFFSDPHSPWQKGAIENANRMIRRYLPRKTVIKDVPMRRIEEIEWKINNIPRKSLGYKTPLEVFTKLAYKASYNQCCTSI